MAIESVAGGRHATPWLLVDFAAVRELTDALAPCPATAFTFILPMLRILLAEPQPDPRIGDEALRSASGRNELFAALCGS